ncbi:polyadenylate-binding protein [Tanacetum coccineum]
MLPGGPINGTTMKPERALKENVTILENVCWKELRLLVFVWIASLGLQIAKMFWLILLILGYQRTGTGAETNIVRLQIDHSGSRVVAMDEGQKADKGVSVKEYLVETVKRGQQVVEVNLQRDGDRGAQRGVYQQNVSLLVNKERFISKMKALLVNKESFSYAMDQLSLTGNALELHADSVMRSRSALNTGNKLAMQEFMNLLIGASSFKEAMKMGIMVLRGRMYRGYPGRNMGDGNIGAGMLSVPYDMGAMLLRDVDAAMQQSMHIAALGSALAIALLEQHRTMLGENLHLQLTKIGDGPKFSFPPSSYKALTYEDI